jgi:hypothetical protein
MRGAWLGLALLLPQCGGASGPSNATGPTAQSTPTPTTPTSAGTICTVGQPATGGPVNDPNGPYAHQVVIARSTDGLRISDSRMVIDHASVPDAVRLQDGTLRIYYVNGQDGTIGIARVDGDTVTVIGPMSMNGVRGPAGMADPDAVLLQDGRVRMYYLGNFGSPGGPARGICYADSTDGERFTLGGLAIQFSNPETVTDPSVTRLSTGAWLMAASRGTSSVLARSSDGVTFANETTIGLGGVPELAALDAGRARIYVCAAGIIAYASADTGATWTREATVVPQGTLNARIICDPSLVAGANRFVYKIQP